MDSFKTAAVVVLQEKQNQLLKFLIRTHAEFCNLRIMRFKAFAENLKDDKKYRFSSVSPCSYGCVSYSFSEFERFLFHLCLESIVRKPIIECPQFKSCLVA